MVAPFEMRIPDSRMAFGVVPEHVDICLQQATAAGASRNPDLCETLLWEAHRRGPRVLPVFLALYRFYFYRQQMDQAERVATIALTAAAGQGGFDADWRNLTRDSADWDAQGAPHFYLFTLKAPAFINLRANRMEQVLALLEKLQELDPHDRVGYAVVAALAVRCLRETD